MAELCAKRNFSASSSILTIDAEPAAARKDSRPAVPGVYCVSAAARPFTLFNTLRGNLPALYPLSIDSVA